MMRLILCLVACLMLAITVEGHAAGPVSATAAAPSLTEGTANSFSSDLAGNVRTTLGTLLSGEDQTNNVLKVEQRFSYQAPVVADTQVKASPGFLHCIWITQNDAAPTAGTIIIYDNTAESGTQVFNWTLTTAVFNPIVLCPDIVMATGIYIGFTTTADVNVSVSYR
jgi:hypothetical protein